MHLMEKSNELNRQQHYTPDSKPMVKGVASACFALDVDVCVCARRIKYSLVQQFFSLAVRSILSFCFCSFHSFLSLLSLPCAFCK